MKPAPFDYAAPASVAEAVALLDDPDRDVTILAGGQSLVPMLNVRLARPDLVVDIGRIPGLAGISERGDVLVFGAMTTKAEVESSELVRRRQPLLHAATKLVGHPQIRNRGTVGGSMAHADPAAEYPAVALVTDTWLQAEGSRGPRTIGAAEFFVGPLTTALADDELLIEIGVPALPEGTGWSFTELSRRHGDFAMAGVAVTVRLDGAGRFSDVRMAVFAVSSVPARMTAAEDLLRGEQPGATTYRRAAGAVRDAIAEPLSDIHASGDYRRHLAGVLAERALAEAVSRATPTTGRRERGRGEEQGSVPRPVRPSGARAARPAGPGAGGVTAEGGLLVRLRVNGVAREALVEPRTTLVELLRTNLGLPGTHVGCESGVCGVCTVVVDGKAVRSCLMLAVQAEGAEITTVEGLTGAGGELHPIQEAFAAEHGLQCGYCTPGFLTALHALLAENPAAGEEEIREVLGGQMCRCTGYHSIMRSARRAAESMRAAVPEAVR